MKNRFVIITPCYSVEKWVGFNINSVKQQSYSNFIAIYGYDKSQDNTRNEIYKNIQDDNRLFSIDIPEQESQLNNYMHCLNYLKVNNLVSDEDIIIELDSDDWLLHPFVFQFLNEVYQNQNIWMTYGQYLEYPNGTVGGHYQLYINDDVDSSNSYRHHVFPYSHLKSYKYHLVNRVPLEYLIDPRTGKYFNITADFALCMPMVEMAGKNRIYRVSEPLYVYNLANENSESINALAHQKETERIIRQFVPCSRIP